MEGSGLNLVLRSKGYYGGRRSAEFYVVLVDPETDRVIDTVGSIRIDYKHLADFTRDMMTNLMSVELRSSKNNLIAAI
jgi:hypothetical protein